MPPAGAVQAARVAVEMPRAGVVRVARMPRAGVVRVARMPRAGVVKAARVAVEMPRADAGRAAECRVAQTQPADAVAAVARPT
jgi:hypothetical protein